MDMAVSACVPGLVFGDTVYGRMGETAFLCAFFRTPRKIFRLSPHQEKKGEQDKKKNQREKNLIGNHPGKRRS